MKYLNFKSQYNKFPHTNVENHTVICGYDKIANKINELLKDHNVIVFEFYPGVNNEEVKEQLISKLNVDCVINAEDYALPISEIDSMIKRNLTDDRVFGVMSHYVIEDFYDMDKITQLNDNIDSNKKTLVYGFGSSLIKHDLLVYFDMARWEIQLRYRKGMPNWLCSNYDEDRLKKYKRGFFVEWRVADRLKKKVLKNASYYIDTNKENDPKMITIEALFDGIHKVSTNPFRLVPYFDPGVWGGQWMKEVCNLDPNEKNFAWSFDGVPEENSIYLNFEGIDVEVPAINVVFFEPINLLGHKVHARFGTEFPIRFDFLDTIGGGNLSLQVHPLTEYIQDKFGMHYTQDESYYILDALDDAVVYLGVKEGIDKDELINELIEAQKGNKSFDDEKFINKFKAKKHDHFLIPAGTIHCSGRNVMVLEISATPYIFTFKLWDWDRLGLDGLPRPVHINHGQHVIQFDRDTTWVKNNLINQFKEMEDGSTKTGLHEREFIETRRYFFDKKIKMQTMGSVNMNNLVEGKAAVIESINGEFEPYVIHYAETFIIPEHIKEYFIRPLNENEKCGVIKAYVR